MRNTYLAVGIIVVILVIVAFVLVRSRFPQFGQLGKANPTPTPVVESVSEKNEVSVSSHTPASTVVVDSVNLTAPGFAVVYDDQNGQQGNILGNSDLLTPGNHQNITISLSRKTNDGETLYVVIYKDNGDGKFDSASDEQIKDQNANPVKADIKVASGGSSGFQIPATGLGQDDR